MNLRISVAGEAAAAELGALRGVLAGTPTVRRHATLAGPEQVPRTGHMGGVLDVVDLVAGAGFDLANLVATVVMWRAGRPRQPTVVIEGDNGVRVEITSSDPSEIARIVRALEQEE